MTRWRVPSPALPIYPTALSLAFATEIYVLSGISPFPALRTFALALLIPVVLTILGRLALGDRDRGALAAALAVLGIMAGVDLRLGILVALTILALFAERYLLPASARTIRWPRITTIATRVIAVLWLAVGIHILQTGTIGVVVRAIGNETGLRQAVAAAASPADPDIYMIMLDGHARADVLSDHFGVDGAAFVAELESRGFAVATQSRANYTTTAETLGSTFNMAHLADIPRMAGLLDGSAAARQGQVVRDVINDNEVFTHLRARGYWIEAVSSGWEEVAMREADRFIDTGELNEYEVAMLRRTTLGDLLQILAPDAVSAQYRSRIQGALDAVVEDVDRPFDRPVFHFSHVPGPHPPWVFNADGSPRTIADLEATYAETPASTGLTLGELRRAYAGQVIDLDRRLLATLDELDASVAHRGRPAVVVVWSDHGSWLDADGGDVRLRFKNLLAVKSTDRELDVDSDLTTVNLFGTLFAQLFGMPYEARADTTFSYGARDEFDLVAVDDPESVGIHGAGTTQP
jgi:hypothetical protein